MSQREIHAAPQTVPTRLIVVFLLGMVAAAGVGSLGASVIPFAPLAARARHMSGSGQADFFNAEFYGAMQLRLRAIGIANLFLAAVGLAFRRKGYQAVEQIRIDAGRMLADAQEAASRIPTTDRVCLAFLVALAVLLRVRLLSQPMRYDEAFTFLEYASRPFYAALSFYPSPNNHLFHTLLMRCSYLMLGDHPWALRLPVLIGGIFLVPSTYLASRCLYRTESALLAAGLVASSSTLIEYSTNARGYILVCLLFTLALALAAYALHRANLAAWLLLGVVAAAGCYTIPIMLYPIGGIAVWIILCAMRKDNARGDSQILKGACFAAAVAVIGTLELYSPVIAVSGPRAILTNKWVKAVPLSVFARDLPLSFASTWKLWNRDIPWPLMMALAAGFLTGWAWQKRCGRQRVAIATAMLIWIAVLLLTQRVVPFERVWLFALPLYFIVASAGIGLWMSRATTHARAAMAVIAVGTALVVGVEGWRSESVYVSNEGRGLEQMALDLKTRLEPGDAVIAVLPSDAPLRYYFREFGIASSYLNDTNSSRYFAVVNGAAGDSVESVLDLAGRADLKSKPRRVLATFDSAKLYEVGQR